MARIFHPLLQLLVCSTRQELARQVQYLKTENQILRSKLPQRVTTTPEERRRLIKAGRGLGKAIWVLITIVKPATFLKWVNQGSGPKVKPKTNRKTGRPRTPDDVRQLIVKIANETGWGYTRIRGELRKLGISVSRQTVVNMLKDNGLDPNPERGKGTWDQFLKMHADTLWACDFFSKKTWTWRGPIDLYLLVFLHVGSRKVWISAPTAHPDSAWVTQQARNFCMDVADRDEKARIVLHDGDTKFTKQFKEVLKGEKIKPRQITPVSPNLNAYVERFIQTIQQECLDQFVVLGERHLDHIVREFAEHYHKERPHQGVGNERLTKSPVLQTGGIVVRDRLGGLLKHYERAA